MTSTTEFAPRRRVAKGPKRPQYLQNPELDKFMMMITSLMAEVSTLRDRLDTHEALAEAGTVATRGAVEAYELEAGRRDEREAARGAMLNRVFRPLLEELEAARLALSTRDLEDVLASTEASERA